MWQKHLDLTRDSLTCRLLSSVFGIPAILATMESMAVLDSVGVGDLVLLEPLTEDTLMQNLKKRFEHQEIYVSGDGEGYREQQIWESFRLGSTN